MVGKKRDKGRGGGVGGWGRGDNAVEGAVTGDNKGRGGDDEEAEAGERAAQKKAKNKRKP